MRWKWGWHNNPVNGQNQVRQKARAELPFPKYNSEIKKYGRICPAQKILGQGQTKRADLPAGRKRGFPRRQACSTKESSCVKIVF
jgi:hypothetical protein